MALFLPPAIISEVQSVFRDQLDQIKNKRTVVINLANFSSDVLLANIFEVLALILHSFNPPVHLERIILSENGLTTLPDEFALISGNHLRYLDLHDNKFSSVPTALQSSCPNLEGLDLSQNHLNSLPRAVFGSLDHLKILSLKDNKFSYLPPILGELINLESIAVAGNPLEMPSMETIQSMHGSVNDLKAYLLSNSAFLDQQIKLQHSQQQPAQKLALPTTPSLARTRSLSDTRSKSLKATRRMGLIINSNKVTPESSSSVASNPDATPSKPERKLLLPTNDRGDYQSLLQQREPNINFETAIVPSTYTTTTAGSSRSNSPSSSTQGATLSRPGSRNRNRSNTFKDINQMLDNSEFADSEHKSGAYFRRLSTLQERPADESNKLQNGDFLASSAHSEDLSKPSSMSFLRHQAHEGSPVKQLTKKSGTNPQIMQLQNLNQTSHSASQISTTALISSSSQLIYDLGTIMKVARKILFSLSELQLSLKRFTGFCSDKKLSIKVISLLHISKGNIDGLVESMEAVEDTGENQDLILSSIHTCITSFKMILLILSENFNSFVAKIDICFIRMVYLTFFGSFNELQNAFRLLNPTSSVAKSQIAFPRYQSTLGLSNVDTKGKSTQASQSLHEEGQASISDALAISSEAAVPSEEIDERLYQSIDLATKNAQVVFSELTKAINKSAIATANTKSSQPINPAVATKFKELTSVCISSMDITKRLILKLLSIRSNRTPQARRLFWDDISLFLKAILQTFSSVKAIMKDAPILNEVRQSMATLTKTTKELTIILEASSYKSMSELLDSPPSQHMTVSLPSSAILPPASLLHSNSFLNLAQLPGSAAPVRTPLVAAVGSVAAQAILPHQDGLHTSSNTTFPLAPLNIPPLVSSDVLNTGLHTAPVQSMEQFYAKNVNPFDRL